MRLVTRAWHGAMSAWMMLAMLPAVLLAVLIGVMTPRTAAAQSPAAGARSVGQRVVSDSAITQIRLRDGTVLFGHIIGEDSAALRVRTTIGAEVSLARSQIASVRTTQGQVVDGLFWAEDPNGTRLLLASTARPLARGEGYLSTYFLFFPFVGVGLTDRLSLAVGTPLIPGVIGRAWYADAKITLINQPRRALALGAIGGALLNSGAKTSSGGAVYALTTLGDRNASVTLGAGTGLGRSIGTVYSDNGDRRQGTTSNTTLVGILGGEYRSSRRVKLLTENWVTTDGSVLTAGLRFLGDRLSTDLGVGSTIGDGEWHCCLPTVSFLWSFGREAGTRR